MSEGSGSRRCGLCSPPSVWHSACSHPSSSLALLAPAAHLAWGAGKWSEQRCRIRSGFKIWWADSLKNKFTWLKILQLQSNEKMHLVFPNGTGGGNRYRKFSTRKCQSLAQPSHLYRAHQLQMSFLWYFGMSLLLELCYLVLINLEDHAWRPERCPQTLDRRRRFSPSHNKGYLCLNSSVLLTMDVYAIVVAMSLWHSSVS